MLMSRCTNVNPSNFPATAGCTWQNGIWGNLPPSESESIFEFQVFAKSASKFGLKIDDSYEISYSNHLNIAMEDITWMIIRDFADSVNMEHLCIW